MKILFTSTHLAPFIREDLALLEKHFTVRPLTVRGPFAPLRILLAGLRADATFTWFASVYSAFAVLASRLTGKPSFIVVGGVDASRIPGIRYGIWLNPWKAVFVRWAMRNAGRLLIVDPFFRGEIIRLAEYDGANIEYVPTGYDPEFWVPRGEKTRTVLSVAPSHDVWRFRKKGLDVLMEAARRLPRVPFDVVGIAPRLIGELAGEAPVNFRLHPPVPRDALLPLYQRAKVYCQSSAAEGLPNSLCEAMLCGCVPVGTHVGGIPTAIDGCGYLVPYGDPGALASALEKALDAPPDAGTAARNRIAGTFTLRRREEALLRLLGEGSR
ncbi:MAG: glycosyltransferase family 4 protein [Bacteroidota bacterium]